MTTPIIPETQIIEELRNLLADAANSIMSAATLLCGWLDNKDTSISKLVAAKAFTRDLLTSLEKVGRGQLRADLLLANSPGHRALKKTPLSVQNMYMTDPIEVVVIRDGKFDKLSVVIENLSKHQVRQVFDKGTIRDEGGQRAYLETVNTFFQHPKAKLLTWRTVKDRIEVEPNGPFSLSIKDLLAMMNALQK